MIVLLSSDILKVTVHSHRDGSNEHQDYMDMVGGTSGVKGLSPSLANSLDKQAVPQSATTLPKEPVMYVF